MTMGELLVMAGVVFAAAIIAYNVVRQRQERRRLRKRVVMMARPMTKYERER